jgi:hypothetical protein
MLVGLYSMFQLAESGKSCLLNSIFTPEGEQTPIIDLPRNCDEGIVKKVLRDIVIRGCEKIKQLIMHNS